MKKIDTIIVTSDEPWSPVWHTQLHYAVQLSSIYNVIFINPPKKWKFSNLFRFLSKKMLKVEENILVYNYHNWTPSTFGMLSTLINDKLNEWAINRNLKNKIIDIVWHFDPYRCFYFYRNNRIKHIYHVIDRFYNKILDKRLCSYSDVVVVTSPKVKNYYSRMNQNTILIPQGISSDLVTKFNKKLTTSGSSNKKLVLLGSLTDKVNYPLLIRVLDETDLDLLIIGPDMLRVEENKKAFKTITDFIKVEWTGALAPSGYLALLKKEYLGIIAYKADKKDNKILRSPLKVISYLVKGMPVLTNIDCEIPSLVNEGIYERIPDDEYISFIKKYDKKTISLNRTLVFEFLNSIRYDILIDRILSHTYNEEGCES